MGAFNYYAFSYTPFIALERMVVKLKGKQVSLQLANEFRVSLGLDDNDDPANETDLGVISKQWILKKTAACSPEALVEALVLTPGLGKFASGIGCKILLYIFFKASLFVVYTILSQASDFFN